MLPAGYVSVIVCDTRRAEQWRVALAKEGIEAHVEETDADEAHHGACKVAVPRDQLLIANAMITGVTKGKRDLGEARSGWRAAGAVLAIAAVIVALVRALG